MFRVGGQKADRHTGTGVWGEFIHSTARPVGGIPDPHLHAHCFTFNVTYDPVEKRFKAGEFSAMKRTAPLFQAKFHTRMAGRMADLGYEIVRREKAWEVAGVPLRLIEEFSRRTSEINKLAKELGLEDRPERKAELGAHTRERKAKELALDTLQADWAGRAGSARVRGLQSLVEQARSAKPNYAKQAVRANAAARECVASAVSHLFERRSAVPEHELMAFAYGEAMGKANVAQIEAALKKVPLIRREFGGQAWVTTKEALREEEWMLEFVSDTRGRCTPLLGGNMSSVTELSTTDNGQRFNTCFLRMTK